MRSAVTIDVEGTFAASGLESDEPYRSVERLDDHLAALDVPVTLFVTPGVVEECRDVVRSWVMGPSTVGLHLHPAELQPGGSDRLTSYSLDALKRFIAIGVDVFERHLDFTPLDFRAGRWEYSETLLRALDSMGLQRDASLKPNEPVKPFTSSGVRELPLTVYKHPAVAWRTRRRGFDALPLTVDALLATRPRTVGCYVLTARLLRSTQPYLMVSYHDYDLRDQTIASRLASYVRFLASRSIPVTLETLAERG